MGAELSALYRQSFRKGLEGLDELTSLPRVLDTILLAGHHVEHRRSKAGTKSL